MKRLVLLSILASTLFAAARPPPCAPVVFAVTEKQSAATLRAGQQTKTVLPPVGGPGYPRQLVAVDPRYLKPLGDAKPAADSKAVPDACSWTVNLVGRRASQSAVQ